MQKKIKKISFLLLISFLSLSFYNSSLATPSSWAIYSDEEFIKIRAEQENRFKQEKIFFEKVKKEKKKKENKKKLESLEKNFSSQISNINTIINEWTSKCKVITKKTYNSLNAQNYEINTIKKSLDSAIRNYKIWYYYNPINNSCLESKNFFWKNWFETRESCFACLLAENTDNSIKVVAKVEKQKKQIKIYSDEILWNIADNIIKNKDSEELKNLRDRTKKIIKTLESDELKLKESTKINFLKLLKILDEKNMENNFKNETIIEEDNNNYDSTNDFLKSIFGDQF